MDNGEVVLQKHGVPLLVLGRLTYNTRAPPEFRLYCTFVRYLRRNRVTCTS